MPYIEGGLVPDNVALNLPPPAGDEACREGGDRVMSTSLHEQKLRARVAEILNRWPSA